MKQGRIAFRFAIILLLAIIALFFYQRFSQAPHLSSPFIQPTIERPNEVVTTGVTTLPASMTNNAQAVPTAKVIENEQFIPFTAADYAYTYEGHLNGDEMRLYRFSAEAGQQLIIDLQTEAEGVSYDLTSYDTGQVYKPFGQFNTALTTHLPTTEHYLLRVASFGATADYKLNVTLMPFEASVPDDKERVIRWVAQARQRGLEPERLSSILQSKQWLEKAEDLHILDNGDWAITLTSYDGDFWQSPPGEFVIVGDDGLLFHYSNEIKTTDLSAPKLVVQAPIVGNDDISELLVGAEYCGAHTCSQRYDVIQQTADGYTPLPTADEGIWMSSSEATIHENQIHVYGGFINSKGAGQYQRGITDVWAWNRETEQLERIDQFKEPSTYRIHKLYDGNDLYEMGEYAQAQAIYLDVMTDETLEDGFSHFSPNDSVRDDTLRFGAFRLILTATLLGDMETAEQWNSWLQTNHADHLITQAGTQFLQTFKLSTDIIMACQDVKLLLAGLSPTGYLADMGYNLPTLDNQTICPN